MLRIIVASTLLVALVNAGVLTENAREKRSPQNNGGNGRNGNNDGNGPINSKSMTAPFTALTDGTSEKVNQQVGKNWQDKAAQGTDIQNQGDRVEAQGKQNAQKVEAVNTKAVMTALNDVDKAQDTVPDMMTGSGNGGDNNNANSYNRNSGNNGGGNNGGGNNGGNGGNNGGSNGYSRNDNNNRFNNGGNGRK